MKLSRSVKKSEKGVALVAALLLLILMSALAVALLYKVNYEQSLQSTDTGNNQAFYGAEAGMENLMAGLNSLYHLQSAPLCSDVNALTTTPPPTSDVGVTYPKYQITLQDGSLLTSCVTPPSQIQSITQGPNAGLQAQIVPLTMSVGALRSTGEAVNMIRTVEVARIPIFQFGVFSESDLSFFPGPDFDFNGRVHTNRNLFVASTGTLTFHSPIRAAGDVVRDQLANGQGTLAQSRTGTVNIPTQPSGCDAPVTNCRPLVMTGSVNEGSSIGGPTPTYGGTGAVNTGTPTPWTTLSTSGLPYYGSMILSGTTGAKKLQMAFVKGTVDPIEIIRRPAPAEDTTTSLYQSRLYSQAQIRVLISDDPAELPTGTDGGAQNIRLANYTNPSGGPDYSAGVAVGGSANHTYFAEGTTAAIPDIGTGTNITDTNWVSPPSPFNANNLLLRTATDVNAPIKGAGPSWNLMDGYIRVEYLDKTSGAYVGVTKEWLELGFARGLLPPTAPGTNPVNPNAILILQELADRNADGITNAGSAASSTSSPVTHGTGASACATTDPLGIPPGPGTCVLTGTGGSCTGVNAGKHRTWTYTCTSPIPAVTPELATDVGTGTAITGTATRYNWYPINMYDTREGEFRDVNSGVCKVNGILNLVEIDVANLRKWLKGTIGASGANVDFKTQNGYILYFSDRRGMLVNPTAGVNRKNGEYGFEDILNASSAAGTPDGILDVGEDVNNNNTPDTWGKANLGLGFSLGAGVGDPTRAASCLTTARSNWVSGARHAVRLVDGSQGNLPTRLDTDDGGFTLASENPAYILGDYNANGGFGDPHASSSVIADTVTLLSNNWSDIRMFNFPTAQGSRPAADSWYRVAIATGKNINFPSAPYAGAPQDFGTDGGVHNFLRFLESWGGKNIYYKGSMASMYYSMYATGVFKCCTSVYGAPTRNYAFDLDFLDLSNMPPGTPTVTDVVNLGFQQVF
jgi:hypothetical protein